VAKFLDVHPPGGVNEDMLKKMQNELPDEFGVITENIMYILKLTGFSVSSKLQTKKQ